MAYVFDNINDQLQGEEKINVFGQDPMGGQAQQDNTYRTQQGQRGVQKTEVGSSGGIPASSTSGEARPMERSRARQRAIGANVGKVATPEFTQKLGSNIEQAQTALQNEANQYSQQYADMNYEIGDTDVDKALDQGGDYLQKVSGLLSGDAERVDRFNPETQTEFGDVAGLSTGQGIQDLLAQEAGGALSGRELAFDRMILEKSPEFINIRNQLLGQRAGLQNQLAEYQGDEGLQSQAQENVNTAWTSAQDELKRDLDRERAETQAKLDWKAEQENKRRENLAKNEGKAESAWEAEIRNALAEEFADELRMDDLLKNVDVSPADFFNVGGEVTAEQLMGEQEASRFNLIRNLLGEVGPTAVAGMGAGEDYIMDEAGYRDALVQAAQLQRKIQDQNIQNEITEILSNYPEGGPMSADDVARLNRLSGQLGLPEIYKYNNQYLSPEEIEQMEFKEQTDQLLGAAGIDPGQVINVSGLGGPKKPVSEEQFMRDMNILNSRNNMLTGGA